MIAEVILYVAIASYQVRNVVLAKLSENYLQGFAQKIRQHIEPAAMRHTHANFFDATLRASVKDRIQADHQRLGALKRKAFLPDVACVQENLEGFGFE